MKVVVHHLTQFQKPTEANLQPQTMSAQSQVDNASTPPRPVDDVADSETHCATDVDDGMGSPTRQYAPRGRYKKSKATVPKTAKKTAEASKESNKRKAASDTASTKVTKRAKTMAAAGAAAAAGAVKSAKKKGSASYDRVQAALKELEENEALLTTIAEEDVDSFLHQRSYSDGGFEVEDIDDDDSPSSPKPAPDRKAPAQSGRGLPPATPQQPVAVPWGPWAIAPNDRAGDRSNASLVEVEQKLKNYYLVPFATWWGAPVGAHTKYTAEKRYQVRPEDADALDRKVVHAVLEGHSPGDKAGRMCNGWKSEKTPWSRVEYPTVNFYLQKKDLPADWTAPSGAPSRA